MCQVMQKKVNNVSASVRLRKKTDHKAACSCVKNAYTMLQFHELMPKITTEKNDIRRCYFLHTFQSQKTQTDAKLE
jgi:TATA-box binding protein (TBP) (component of TFIID and TFIIIB)